MSLQKEGGLTEEELPRQKARLMTPPLDPLGVAELQAYIVELRQEIARAESEVARKQDHRSAADSVFRRS